MDTTDATHLHQLLRHLAEGDTAFLFQFVLRYDRPVAARLRRAGAPDRLIDPLVHEVALVVMDLVAGDGLSSAPWQLVDQAIASVLEHPESTMAPPRPGHRCSSTSRAERALHLVDIENLAGGPARVDLWFTPAVHEYLAVAVPGDADQVIAAADIALWRRTAFDLSLSRYLPGFGPDGADQALLDAAPADWVTERFDRLVIGSGDHAFVDLALAAGSSGVEVVVVARPAQLAGSLRRAADTVVALPNLPGPPDEPIQCALPLTVAA